MIPNGLKTMCVLALLLGGAGCLVRDTPGGTVYAPGHSEGHGRALGHDEEHHEDHGEGHGHGHSD